MSKKRNPEKVTRRVALRRGALGAASVIAAGSLSSRAAAEHVKITPEERKMAVRAARSLGLYIAGVDMIRSERGTLVLEVNASPGLEGIETSTGKDVAGAIIEFLEKAQGKLQVVHGVDIVGQIA